MKKIVQQLDMEFIPYEQALALKELGFDEPCFGLWNLNNGKYEVDIISVCKYSPKFKYREVLAPLYQQAFRWFREKYRFQNILWSGKINTIFYGYDILNIDEQKFILNNSENGGGDCNYDTYEEAELECLKKLIEIVNEEINKYYNETYGGNK